MKIIKATWEKRNLGLNVIEIEFEPNDGPKNLKKLGRFKADYFVAKIPIKNLFLAHKLEDDGFRFMETQFSLARDLTKNFQVEPYLEKIANVVAYQKIHSKNELDQILKQIDRDMFDTDRISLDYSLPKRISVNRYRGWMKDEFDKGSTICKLLFGKELIGFFLLKKHDEITLDSVLAGVFSRYKSSGLGAASIGKHIDFCIKNHVKKLIARVSSNNIASLKMHLAFGYEVKGAIYVFRKIKKKI